MLKQIASSFIGTSLAIIIAGTAGYFVATNYIDSKLVVFDRIESLVNVSAEKIDKIFTVVENGVTRVDETVTDSKIYQRIFGKEEE